MPNHGLFSRLGPSIVRDPTRGLVRRIGTFHVCILTWLVAVAGCGAGRDDVDASREREPAVASAPAEGEAAAEQAASVERVTEEQAASVEQATGDQGVEHRIDGTPVTATLRLARGRARAGETVDVSVELDVAPLWEIHTLDARPNSTATRLELELPEGFLVVGEWQAPEPLASVMPGGHGAYAGEAVFTRQIAVTDGAAAGEHRIKCRLGYQACDGRQCLQPATVELSVPLAIE
jgi:hypothetical protein